jgi:very-short-patch-repair endonuclease
LRIGFQSSKIIGNYIVDYYCAEKQVLLESVGSSYDNKAAYDQQTGVYLKSLGLAIIRFRDNDIKFRIEEVMELLRKHPVLGIV